MKRPKPPRAERRVPKATGAPPVPDPSELEASAAGSALSEVGAWWVSAQVADHLFRSIGERDRRTGDPLPGSLQDLLAGLRETGASGRRPFPKDVLAEAADVAEEVVADLLHQHRTRVVRDHVQLPFPSLREVDGRSLAWLARQPGRNVREKLSGRTRALGVRRSPSADTAENRLVRAFAASFVRRGRERLEFRDAYDSGGADDERAEKLSGALRVCDERMRRSELAEVPARVPTRVNNVLLSDPRYARVFRAWRRLREADDGLPEAWTATPHRVALALFWSLAADLLSRSGVLLWDRPAFVATVGGFVPLSKAGPTRVDLLLEEDERAGPRRLRLELADGYVLGELATLEGRGRLTPGPPERLCYQLRLHAAPEEPRRGAPLEVEGVGEAPADLEGLRFLADRLAERVLSTARAWRPPRPCAHAPRWPAAGPIGIELADTHVSVDAGEHVAVVTRGWTCAWGLAGGTAEAWLDGRADRMVEAGGEGTRVFALGDALQPDEAETAGLLALVARRVADALVLELPVGSRLAYTLPDAGEAFSQRTLRVALDAAFGDAKPVWRSVAAAVDWQAQPSCPVRSGDQVLVVDVEFTGACPTLLVAKHDGKLAHELPASQGIYWERKPAFADDDARDGLGWRSVLDGYAEELVRRALRGADPSPDWVRTLAECVVRTGVIAALVEQGGTRQVGIDEGLLELQHDPRWFGNAVDNWLRRLAEALSDVREALPHVTTYVLLVGGPAALAGFSTHGAPQLAHQLGMRVECAPAQAMAAGARACRARIDASLPVWKEWLPDLWLEVVRDGHYAELALLDKDTLVDPFLGGEQKFEVPELLTLAAGKPWYSFPLILGRKDHRPLAWEARVVSPTFPLAADVRVRLRLSYAYGMESTYALALEPLGEAPFERLHARWSRVGEDRGASIVDDAPTFVAQQWSPEKVRGLAEVVQGVASGRLRRDPNFRRFVFAVTRDCWAQGRSVANAVDPVKAQAGWLVTAFSGGYTPSALDLAELPVAFEALCQLHEDAPADVRQQALALDKLAGDDPHAFARTAPLLVGLVGDGQGERRAVLDRLVLRSRRAAGAYNLALGRRVAGALGAALMRHPGLIGAISPDDGSFLIEFGRRSLMSLQRQVPLMASGDELDRARKMFAGPYREWTELLLMLLPLRAGPAGGALRRGSAGADGLGKAVRQIDARFVRMGIDARWRIRLGVQIPEALRRMSPAAYTLCSYLSESGAENLAEVTGAVAE